MQSSSSANGGQVSQLAPSAAGGGNRVGDFLSSLPVVTRIILFVNVMIHILIFLTSASLGNFSISANLVLNKGEYYRIITAAFVHVGLMHIAMNMSSLLQLGHSLESSFGSLQFFFLTLWTTLSTGFIYVAICVIGSYLGFPKMMFSSGVGFSGVLFCYALLEAYHTTETTRSVFGLFDIPAKMHPFVLLIILQVVIPNISFVGHVSGILSGLFVAFGLMQFVLPSVETLYTLETYSCFALLTKSGGYIRVNNRNLVHPGASASSCSLFSACWGALSICALHVGNTLSAALYIIGCPVERVTLCCSQMLASITSFCASLQSLRPPSVPPPQQPAETSLGANVELGRYSRLVQEESSHSHSSTHASVATSDKPMVPLTTI